MEATMGTPQQEAKNFDPVEEVRLARKDAQEREREKRLREFESIIRRYPGDLSEEKRLDFLGEVRGALPRGLYENEDGKRLYVKELSFREGRERAAELWVSFHFEDEADVHELYVSFFVLKNRFVRIDHASV